MPDSTLDSLLNHPGGAPAIVTPSETISFAELSGRVEACAAMLAKDHVRAGQPIGLAFSDPIGHLVVSLALLKLGAQQLALSVSDPAGVLDAAAARAGVTLIVTDQATLPAKAPRLTVNWRRLPPVKPVPGRVRDEASFLLLGSGTTGRPKLISLTAEQFELQIDRELDARPIAPGDRFASIPSINFLIAKRAMFACLKAGGTVVLSQKDKWGLELFDRLAVDHLMMIVLHARQTLAALLHGGGSGERLPGLKSLTVRSSPVAEHLRAELRSKVSRNSWIAYGTNEFGTATMALPENQTDHPGTVGQPCAGVELEIVDDDHNRLPHGQTGHIRMRAPGMFSGYVDAPQETAMALRDGWFYPKDLGALLSDGTLIFKGRSDDMMIYDGINIPPREIERALEDHAAVDEAVAFAMPSPEHGDLPSAAVLSNRKVSEKELRDHCRALIGSMAPVHIFDFAEFPRNPAGKVNKRKIRARIEKQALHALGKATASPSRTRSGE